MASAVGQEWEGVSFQSKLAIVISFDRQSFSHRGWPKDNLMQYVMFGGLLETGNCVVGAIQSNWDGMLARFLWSTQIQTHPSRRLRPSRLRSSPT